MSHCNFANGKGKVSLQVLVALSLCVVSANCKPEPNGVSATKMVDPGTGTNAAYEENLDSIFGGAAFDYFPEHNQAIDAIVTARSQGLLPDQPAILIHVDAHPDYATPDDRNYHKIGSWIPFLLLENYVDQVYFVGMAPRAANQPADSSTGTLYMDRANKVVFGEKPADFGAQPDRYVTINIPVISVTDLPTGIGSDGHKPVILDIDVDYFTCDTGWTGNPLPDRVNAFLEQIRKSGIHPVFADGTLSRGYTTHCMGRPLDNPPMELERFLQDAGAHSKTRGDLIAGYDHTNVTHIPGQPVPPYPVQTGKPIILRNADKALQAMYAMRFVDFHDNNAQGTIPTEKSNQLRRKVVDRLTQIYGSSENDVQKMLEDWDAADGHKDGMVAYATIENQIVDKLQAKTP